VLRVHRRCLLAQRIESLRGGKDDPRGGDRFRWNAGPTVTARQRAAHQRIRRDHRAVRELHGPDGGSAGSQHHALAQLRMPAGSGPAADAEGVAAVKHRAAADARPQRDEDLAAGRDPHLALDPGARAETRLREQPSGFEQQNVQGPEREHQRVARALVDPSSETVDGQGPERPRRQQQAQPGAETTCSVHAGEVCKIRPDAAQTARNVTRARHRPPLRARRLGTIRQSG